MDTELKYKESACIVAVCILLAVVMIVVASIVKADSLLVRDSGTFDTVQNVEDVPLNECRYVKNVPLPIDKMYLPEPILMCNTLGVVGVVDYKL